ncbi:MAG: helix-turn-helix domain-containing protein [Planctomycetota bacterium]
MYALRKALKLARNEKELTQEKLAFLADLHPTYISQLERGLKSPSLDAISALAKPLGLKAHQLVKRAEEI